MDNLGEMVIKFVYFFNSIPGTRLVSNPKRPFNQTRLNSLFLTSILLSPKTHPVLLWIFAPLKGFSETGKALCGEGIGTVGMWVVYRLVGGSPRTPDCLGVTLYLLPSLKGDLQVQKVGEFSGHPFPPWWWLRESTVGGFSHHWP